MAGREQHWQRFRIIRQLGAGAFGRTLLVLDQTKEDREVVIKVPHDEDKEEALVREIINVTALNTNLSSMSHPNIVRCLGFAKFEGLYVMILEYVDGPDLRKVIGPPNVVRRPMEITRAVEIFTGICAGLGAAHRISLLHRDVKPENILIREADGVAKLVDFGISTIVRTTTVASGTVAGTFPYMAPEAWAGQSTPQSDLWSLCATFYEMLTGRLPFLDENTFELKRKIEKEDPTPPSRLNPRIEERLNCLVLKGLAKSTSRRFQTADEILAALGVPRQGVQMENGGSRADLGCAIDVARQRFQEGHEEEAEKGARELLGRYPDEPSLYLLLGEFAGRRQQFREAEDVLSKGMEICPSSAPLCFHLAPVLWAQGGRRRERAVTILRKAIQLGLSKPQEKQARNLLRSWEAQGGRN